MPMRYGGINLGVDVAVGGDDPATAYRDIDAAAGAAVPARRLAPLELAVTFGHRFGEVGRQWNPGCDGGARHGGIADELASTGHPVHS